MRVIFARGKSSEQSLCEPVSAGSFILPVTNATTFFTPGDLMFISDADSSNVIFSGPVGSVGVDEVQCAFALTENKLGGSLCWKAEEAFVWPIERSTPCIQTMHTGISPRESVGGTLFLTKLSESRTTEILRFEKLYHSDVQNFENWMADVISGGMQSFTFVDETGLVSVAALLSTTLEKTARSRDSISLELHLRILKKDAFV